MITEGDAWYDDGDHDDDRLHIVLLLSTVLSNAFGLLDLNESKIKFERLRCDWFPTNLFPSGIPRQFLFSTHRTRVTSILIYLFWNQIRGIFSLKVTNAFEIRWFENCLSKKFGTKRMTFETSLLDETSFKCVWSQTLTLPFHGHACTLNLHEIQHVWMLCWIFFGCTDLAINRAKVRRRKAKRLGQGDSH